jgi:CDP-6-deoxy-D-xylo-4-hexulose-3-dehydrase
MEPNEREKIKSEILDGVRRYYHLVHSKREFVGGESKLSYAGRVFDDAEMVAATQSLLDFYLTLGDKGREFEQKFAEMMNLKYSVLTNSGSSANLLATTALCSWMHPKKLMPGNEVITVAASFPTTINPIIQNNLVPVFVDVELGTYNIDPKKLEGALSEKTKAIIFAHTLGNPADMEKITEFAKKHNLLLMEDCCDALGSKFDGKNVGTFGEAATCSFYPAHHIPMGEGGAISTNSKLVDKILRSLRDWGRSCWCDPGKSNTCGVRFEYKVDGIPYDHKYIYDNIGYNLKPLDLQAAIGLEQLKKAGGFIKARKENFNRLYAGLKDFEGYFILPRWHKLADPSWFGFPLTIREETGIKLQDMQKHLDADLIESRLLFSGNIIRHPGYKRVKYRIPEKLENTDTIMRNTFFLGVYPGIDQKMCNYMVKSIGKFIRK